MWTVERELLHDASVEPGLDHVAALGLGLDAAGGVEIPAGDAKKALETFAWPR